MDLTQGSSSWSKCKGMVCCHGHRANQAETWQVLYSLGDMVTYMFWTSWTPPPGRRWPRSGSGDPCSLNWAFMGKLYKTEAGEHPCGMGQVRSGPEPHPGVWRPVQGQGEGLLPWYLGRLGRNLDCVLSIWLHSQRDVFDTPHFWPDCSGKHVRAPKGLLPGEQPEQHKFAMRNTIYFNFHIFI